MSIQYSYIDQYMSACMYVCMHVYILNPLLSRLIGVAIFRDSRKRDGGIEEPMGIIVIRALLP